MRKHESSSVVKWIIVVVALLVLSQVATYAGLFSDKKVAKVVDDGEWICTQVACKSFMSEAEIVKNYCHLSETGDGVCDVNVDGQVQSVPLKSLNLSAVQVCAEQVCLGESKMRLVNYTLEQPTN